MAGITKAPTPPRSTLHERQLFARCTISRLQHTGTTSVNDPLLEWVKLGRAQSRNTYPKPWSCTAEYNFRLGVISRLSHTQPTPELAPSDFILERATHHFHLSRPPKFSPDVIAAFSYDGLPYLRSILPSSSIASQIVQLHRSRQYQIPLRRR